MPRCRSGRPGQPPPTHTALPMHAAFPLIHPPLQQAQPGATGTPGQPAMVSTVPGTTPLVFDSPHSGTALPGRLPLRLQPAHPAPRRRHARRKNLRLRPRPGRGLGRSPLPRIYLDANRDTLELDTTLLDAPGPTQSPQTPPC